MAAGSIPAYGYLSQAFSSMKFKPLPPLEEVRKYLSYDPESGEFTWLKFSGSKPPGSAAGSIRNNSYLVIALHGTDYVAHRLAWLLVTGSDPGSLRVDHRDHNGLNNRFDNLRLATAKQNADNQRAKGFSLDKHSGKYHAYVRHHGRLHSLGHHDCPLIARLAYEDKKRELCGEFSPV